MNISMKNVKENKVIYRKKIDSGMEEYAGNNFTKDVNNLEDSFLQKSDTNKRIKKIIKKKNIRNVHHLKQRLRKFSENKSLQKKLGNKSKQEIKNVLERTVYVGHIPFGFFEKEMYQFFSQFGTIEKLRYARSERTGRFKGYAFIQFKDEGVAEVVANTMNNYIMFKKSLICQLCSHYYSNPCTDVSHDKLPNKKSNIVKNMRKKSPKIKYSGYGTTPDKTESKRISSNKLQYKINLQKTITKHNKPHDERIHIKKINEADKNLNLSIKEYNPRIIERRFQKLQKKLEAIKNLGEDLEI